MKFLEDFRGLVAEAEFEQFVDKEVSDVWTWLEIRVGALATIIHYQVGGWWCKRFGHSEQVECGEFVACDRDEAGNIVDIDGGGVSWFCPRCGQGGRNWF